MADSSIALWRMNKRCEEIYSKIVSKIRSHVPNGGTDLNEILIKKCLRDCAGLQKEYNSLQTAMKFLRDEEDS